MDFYGIPPGPDGKIHRVLKRTWTFKLKQLPTVIPPKYKYWYCFCEFLQKSGVDYFKTYDPIFQRSTIRLAITIILPKKLHTKQVDYTNAFSQEDFKGKVYIYPPRGFVGCDDTSKFFRLIKSLLGIHRSPKAFFDKLWAGILEHRFI